MRTLRLIPILAVLFTAAPASAQVSIWLQRGVSGFGFGLGAFRDTENKVTSASFGGGYSYQGWIDFDLNLQYSVPDDDSASGLLDITEFAISPSVQWHPIKQSKTVPISFAVSVGFSQSVLMSDNFVGDEGGGVTGVGASASVYRFFRLGESTGIIPAAAFAVNYSHLALQDEFGDDIELEDPNDTSYAITLGAYIAYIDSSGRIWGVVPQVSFGDNVTSFGVSVNLIFSQPPREEPQTQTQ